MINRLVKYAVKNTLRNKFLSISSILVLTLLMFFINVLQILENISWEIIKNINSKMTISLYLDDKYTEKNLEVSDLIDDIHKINDKINVEYKTKESLLRQWRQREPRLVSILEKDNPLPNTIVISNVDIPYYKELNNKIENKLFILEKRNDKEYFANYTTQYERINKIISVLTLLKNWLYFIIAIFFVAIAVINYSVISNFVYYYKDEIYITKLVWWSNIFIFGPFVLQGILYSIFSFILNILIFLFLLKNLNVLFIEYYEFKISISIVLIELILFIFIWAISGYFSSRKFLRKTIYS